MTYSTVDSKIVSYTVSYMAVLLAEACVVMTNPTLVATRKLYVYHFSLNTAATQFNFPIVMWHEEMTRTGFNYIIIIGGLNVGNFI